MCSYAEPSRDVKSKIASMSYYEGAKRGEVVSCDILEGFVKHFQSDKILVLADHATAFVRVLPLKRATGSQVAELIETEWATIFSPPRILLSDNGSNLTRNFKVRKLLEYYKIEPKNTMAWSSKSHGFIENHVV